MLSRKLQLTAKDLSEWRDKFLAAGEASLKAWSRDGQESEIIRLKNKVGGLIMDNKPLSVGLRYNNIHDKVINNIQQINFTLLI
jgi:hypothetical protein